MDVSALDGLWMCFEVLFLGPAGEVTLMGKDMYYRIVVSAQGWSDRVRSSWRN